ncbi:DUF2218 domain-containing protein [Nonomuraea sp. NPDC050153]|uniref:DUF2218 domain-containing protein n=1 Tax=Nonomuraea sp. NPDC050153 TaxID=3364359 RepID=UPI0037BC73F3
MPTAEAHVTTDRAGRYLVQLCRHATQMGHGLPAHPGRRPHPGGERPKDIKAEYSETEGTITVDGATCFLRATPTALTVRVEAGDQDGLQRVQTLVTRNITRMGRRDNLTVDWSGPGATVGAAIVNPAPRRRRHAVLGLTLAAVLAVAVHVGLAAGLLAIPRWAGLGADVVLVAVLVKAALVATHLWRRRRSAAKAG